MKGTIIETITQEHLKKYKGWEMRVASDRERIARAKSEELFPGMKESDGSKHQAGASDRMANAVIRRLDIEEKLLPRIVATIEKMEAVEAAVAALDDPMEEEVLTLRYIIGDGSRWMKWPEVAKRIYRDDDERHLQAVYRLHGRALQSLRKVSVEE